MFLFRVVSSIFKKGSEQQLILKFLKRDYNIEYILKCGKSVLKRELLPFLVQ